MVWGAVVELRPLTGPLSILQMLHGGITEHQWKIEGHGEQTVPVPFCPAQISDIIP